MAGVFDCGFARVAVKESYRALGCRGKDRSEKYRVYIGFFEEHYKENFQVSQKTFSKRSAILVNTFNNWKNVEDKSKYIKHYSNDSWLKLLAYQKEAHYSTNCRACEVYHNSMQDLFPSRCNRTKKLSLTNLATSEIEKQKKVKPTLRAMKETVRNVIDTINKPFKDIFNTDFTEALVKVPELKLQEKTSRAEIKKERRQSINKQKKTIEEHWTAMDITTFLGTRQSFSQRDQQRKGLSFENIHDAN